MQRGLTLWLALFLAGCVMWKPSKPVRRKPPIIRPAAELERRTATDDLGDNVYVERGPHD